MTQQAGGERKFVDPVPDFRRKITKIPLSTNTVTHKSDMEFGRLGVLLWNFVKYMRKNN